VIWIDSDVAYMTSDQWYEALFDHDHVEHSLVIQFRSSDKARVWCDTCQLVVHK
jgi:hypothetical protein